MEKFIICTLIWVVFYLLLDKFFAYLLKESLIKIYSKGLEDTVAELEILLKNCEDAENHSEYIHNLRMLDIAQRYFYYKLGILHNLNFKEVKEYEKYLDRYPKRKYF